MCGICGIISQKEKIRAKSFKKILDTMEDRGPDDWGVYIEGIGKIDNKEALANQQGSLMLGQRRLKIIDLTKAANQPMANEDNSLWITFNGEIYNFQELRKDLEKKGHQFKSRSDTEVILHLYEDYGYSCVKYLRGIFSFAILDKRKKELFCARDHLGVKPFYYYKDNNLFLFASEVKAILASGFVKKELDPLAVSDYFTFLSVIEPRTIVKNVRTLLPGHYLVYQNGKVRIEKYWDLERFKNQNSRTDKQLIRDNIRKLLEESVKMQMVSDVPLGAFLSGGIDSSSVVALASKYSSGPLKTISLVFKEKEFDERPFSQKISQKFKTEHYQVLISEKDVLNEIPSFIEAMDQPTGDGLNTYLISKIARQGGLAVVLSGLGGDEVFGGYRSFKKLPGLYRFIKKWNLLPKFIQRKIINILIKHKKENLKCQRLLGFLKSQREFFDIYLSSRTAFPASFRKRIFSKSFQEKIKEEGDREECLKGFRGEIKDLDLINAVSYLESNIYMRNTLLRDTDVMSMNHSLEVRVPLLDHKLVEYVFSLPGDLKIDKRLQKPLLVNSLKDFLPKEVYTRKKMGFTLPLEKWLRGELVNLFEGSLSGLKKREYFNLNEVEKIWHMFLEKKGEVNWSRPWLFLVFKLWCQKHLD